MESTPAQPPDRLQIVLPAILTFVFGLGAGVVIGYVAWAGRQVEPSAEPPQQQAAAQQTLGEGGEGGGGEEENPEQLRQRLALHEALLEKSPDDPRLLRTVGNYHGLLGDNAKAMEVYARAETITRAASDTANLVDVLTDQSVSLTEMGDLPGALAKLTEAETTAPKDIRSRLTHAVILMTRVMPNPPPGFDRKVAVQEAEQLLKDVLAIEPSEPNALELLAMIASIRNSMGRGGPGAAGPGAAGQPGPAGEPTGSSAPAGASAPAAP